MTKPLRAAALLRTADKLAGREAGSGRPAVTDLRRATSTAYYALFHRITRDGVIAALPSAVETDIAHVARWFTHAGIRAAADLVVVANGTNAPRRPDTSPVALLRNAGLPLQLVIVAESFTELQDRRIEADYDNDYDPVRWSTLDHVATAREAVTAAWALQRAVSSRRAERQKAHDAYRRFLLLALVKSGGPRTR